MGLDRPRLTLRIAFAGNIALPEPPDGMRRALRQVLSAAVEQLLELAKAYRDSAARPVSSAYADQRPLLVLTTGLAEGADTEAAELWLALKEEMKERAELRLNAVLGCSVAQYRESRPPAHHAAFDRHLAECDHVLVLDGRYLKEKPPEKGADSALGKPWVDRGKPMRSRMYRAQSVYLLRQCDLLLAVADPAAEGGAGGTMETVRNAQQLGLPVTLVHTGTGAVQYVPPWQDLMALSATDLEQEQEMQLSSPLPLREWIERITGDPDMPDPGAAARADHEHGARLLRIYFSGEVRDRPSWRGRLYGRFERLFVQGSATAKDSELPGYRPYRQRAAQLGRYYTGLYRGAFLMNYALAVLAVLCAALSMLIIGKTHTELGEGVGVMFRVQEEISVRPERMGFGAAEALALLALGALKLFCLAAIIWNTWSANRNSWNALAVDFRYLAERLRTMHYLPRLGALRPPAASAPQYASRVLHQSATVWLAEALVRSIDPFGPGGALPLAGPRTNAPDVPAVIGLMRDHWLRVQLDYHARNRDAMGRMHRSLERLAIWLRRAVVALLAVDLVIIALYLLRMLDGSALLAINGAMPLLVGMAAFLPVLLASVGGIQYQSECERLHERSRIMHLVLGQRDKEAAELRARMARAGETDTDNGAWCLEALRIGEAIARDLVHEVTEWSVLYTKEVDEA